MCPVASWSGSGQPGEPARAKGAGVPTLQLQGQLPSRNASLREAEAAWRSAAVPFSPLRPKEPSLYWKDVVQGASLVPGCVWFAQPPPEAIVIPERRPNLDTDPSTHRQAKPPWKVKNLTGGVEWDFLYATLLSDHMLPFGWRKLSLVVLPVVQAPDGRLQMLEMLDAVRRGKMGLADWVRKAEALGLEHRKSEANLRDWIDWQGKLTRQRATRTLKVLYNRQGSHVAPASSTRATPRIGKSASLGCAGS